MRRLGSATFKKRTLRRGTEADECYYIQHEKQARGKKQIDLRRDPRPDLVLEADISHHAELRGGKANLPAPEARQVRASGEQPRAAVHAGVPGPASSHDAR